MGTRSTIAILLNDGTVNSGYCHWDGYLAHNGLILYKHYQDVNKVKELINLGSMSSLGPEVNPPKGVQHSYDKPYEGVTTFYGRDRGEDDQEPSAFPSLEEYVKNGDFQEYDYVFSEPENKWYLLNTRNGKLDDLREVMLDSDDVPADEKIVMKNGKIFNEICEELEHKDGPLEAILKV